MPIRKNVLANGCYYHIYVRSIAGFVVFNNSYEYKAMLDLINLCKYVDFQMKYSRYKTLKSESQTSYLKVLEGDSKKSVDVISYCLMPTHVHLLLKQNTNNGISNFMNRILSSYSKNFNIIHKRNGPLRTTRFKNVKIDNDEQLLHLTRYIHLNPTSKELVEKPEYWRYSSYNTYISKERCAMNSEIINMNSDEYRNFVEDRKQYQRQLLVMKSLLIESYTS